MSTPAPPSILPVPETLDIEGTWHAVLGNPFADVSEWTAETMPRVSPQGGMLGGRLKLGLDRLPMAEADALLEHDSLDQALVVAVHRLTCAPVYLSRRNDSRIIALPTKNGGIAYQVLTGRPAADYWTGIDTQTREPIDDEHGTGREATLRRRRMTLPFDLNSFSTAPSSVDVIVREPYVASSIPSWLWTAATLRIWWDARLREGCTPEVARMLLGLTVDPATLPHIRYTETGHPAPVFI